VAYERGVTVQVPLPLQVAPPLQVPQVPPHPSEPHCFPAHDGAQPHCPV
jgi:hypothetical protein